MSDNRFHFTEGGRFYTAPPWARALACRSLRSAGALLLLLGSVASLPAQSQTRHSDGVVIADNSIQYYRDKSNRLTLDDIVALPARSWEAVPGGFPSFGFIDDTLWLRLRVQNNSQSDHLVLEFGYGILDHVQVYLANAPVVADPESVCIGDKHPIERRAIRGRFPAVPLSLIPGQTALVHTAVRTETSMQFPLRVYTQESYARRVETDSLVHGLYFGLMVAMLTYNLFVAFTSRSLAYLLYVGYVAFSTVFFFCVQGLAHRYSFPSGAFWRNEAVPAYLAAFTVFIALFSARFLHTRRHSPRGRILLLGMAVYSLVSIPLSLLLPYRYTAAMALAPGVVMPFVLLPVAIICWKRGFDAARYFILAWVILLFAFAHRVLSLYGFIPADPFLSEYGVLVATALETVLLAMALGDRMRRLELERAELARLTRDIELAREIQESLLPKAPPPVPGLRLHARHRAMASVGGDFYDFRRTEKGVGVLLADVSGHGVPAALVVSVVKTGFWFQRDSLASPARLLGSMSDILRGKIGEQFVTAAYFYFDSSEQRLFIGNAGHPPLLLQKAGDSSVEELRPIGRVLGLDLSDVYATESLTLQPGDRLVMYTDGIFEQSNARGEQFGADRLREFLADNRTLDGQSLADRVMDAVFRWGGGEEKLSDDVAIVVADAIEA